MGMELTSTTEFAQLYAFFRSILDLLQEMFTIFLAMWSQCPNRKTELSWLIYAKRDTKDACHKILSMADPVGWARIFSRMALGPTW